jgi:hypothetical protein
MVKKKKISWSWLLVIFLIVFVSLNIYNSFKPSEYLNEYKQNCNITSNNQIEFDKCIQFKIEFEKMGEPIIDIETIGASLIISLVIFLILRFLLSFDSKHPNK